MSMENKNPPKSGGFSSKKEKKVAKVLPNSKKKSDSSIRQKKKSNHTTWEFKPKLANMGAVLHSIDQSVDPEVYNVWVQSWRAEIQKLIRAHGFTEGARRINLVRDYTIQLVEGRSPIITEWLAISASFKVPSCLHEDFIKYIISYLSLENAKDLPEHKQYQIILTILNIQRLYEGLVDPSFGSIIEKKMVIEVDFKEEFSVFVKEFLRKKKLLKKFPIFTPDQVNFEDYRFNLNKNGPNGLPKLESAHKEAVVLCGSKLYTPWKRLASFMGFDLLHEYVSLLAKTKIPSNRKESILTVDSTHLRKVVSVPDKGFKTRIVAINDFWTQLLLEPLRAYVQAVIQFLFKQDYRMCQEDGVNSMILFQNDCLAGKVVNGHTLDIQGMRFYDISAWTDRFHHDLQKVVMIHLFNAGIAEMHAQLTVHCLWYSPDLDTHIKYGQGQGMGTNGSFDIATLTEHLYIHFMYERSSIGKVFSQLPYGKVGDDLWIYDPENNYPEYCKKINLPINTQKSKVYCELGSVAEFCSRTAINGIDVSRVSPNVINRSSEFRNIPQLLSVCNQRGLTLKPSSFPTLQNTLKNSEERYIDKLQPWLISAVVLNAFLKNTSSPYGFLNADYLVQNDWITNESVKTLIRDQESLMRIMVGNSIISILKSQDLINKKISTLRSVENGSKSYDEMSSIFNIDLFTTDQSIVEMIRENLGFQFQSERIESGSTWKMVLLPWEIVPIVRLKSLKKSVTVKLLAAHDIEGDKIEDILDFATQLDRIAVSVDFDGTNINYESKRVYDRQFSIVKFFLKCKEPFNELELDELQINSINSILSYEELPVEWVNSYLPKLVLAKTEDVIK
jgi:hypothetical protein